MKNLLFTLLMFIPFGLLSQTNVIEPELADSKIFKDNRQYNFTKHNNLLYINADDGIHGLELWVIDGSQDGMRLLKDINPKDDTNPIVVNNELEGKVLFVADDIPDNSLYPSSLWATDGTSEGTLKLTDLSTKVYSDYGKISVHSDNFIKINDKVYFKKESVIFEGLKIWVTDGTKEGTNEVLTIQYDWDDKIFRLNDKLMLINSNRLYNIDLSKKELELISSDIKEPNLINLGFQVVDSLFYFINVENQNYTLWCTDGTKAGTLNLTPNNDNNNYYTNVNVVYQYNFNGNNLFIFEKDSSHLILKTNGNIESTTELLRLNGDEGVSRYIEWITPLNELFYFMTYTNEGTSYWSTDGTKENTKILLTFDKTVNHKSDFIFNNKLFYNTRINDIYKTYAIDGNRDQPEELFNGIIRLNPINSINNEIIVQRSESLNDDISLVVTDGTTENTRLLSPYLTNLHELIIPGKKLGDNHYFHFHNNGEPLFELWRTDFTESGTQKIIMPNKYFSERSRYRIDFEELNGFDYFLYPSSKGQQLYRIPNTITSVEDTPKQELMTLYPNPAKDYIQLELDKPKQLSIVNSTGSKVKDYDMVADGMLNVAGLSTGVYFVVDEQGKNIAKFVKE